MKLAWISNDATRRATLKKRRKGLLKKVRELSILCDVRACAIIYSPNEPQPEVWPSAAEAARLLSRFRALPEMEQSKKMMNQETFLCQRASKLHDKLRRYDRENHDLESAALLREAMAGASVSSLHIEELAALAWALDHRNKAVQDRIDHLNLSAALERPVADNGGDVAVECTAVMPTPPSLRSQFPTLIPTSIFRDDQLGQSCHEMRWFVNGGEGGAVTGGGNHSYQQMDQLGRAGEGSCGAAAAFVEQNQDNWENFFPY